MVVSIEEVIRYSETDEEILKIKKGILDGVWDKKVNTYKIFESELCFQDAILLKGSKLVIPVKLRERVLKQHMKAILRSS